MSVKDKFANISSLWQRGYSLRRRAADDADDKRLGEGHVSSLPTFALPSARPPGLKSPTFTALIAVVATVAMILVGNMVSVGVFRGSSFGFEASSLTNLGLDNTAQIDVTAGAVMPPNPEEEADSDGIRVVRPQSYGLSDDDADIPDPEDDDEEGVLNMKQRLQRLQKAQQAAAAAASASLGAIGAAAGATALDPGLPQPGSAVPAAAVVKRVDPAMAAECARRMTGTALMDYDRVLLPSKVLPPPPVPQQQPLRPSSFDSTVSGGGRRKAKKQRALERKQQREAMLAGRSPSIDDGRGIVIDSVPADEARSSSSLQQLRVQGDADTDAESGEAEEDDNEEASDGSDTSAAPSSGGIDAQDQTAEMAAPLAQSPAAAIAAEDDKDEVPWTSLPREDSVAGLQFYRPLTLLLDDEHLLIGDLFLAGECVVFVTVKNKAQPDWLVLRRILLEVTLDDNTTLSTPFSNVAVSQADAREPVGVGKHCLRSGVTLNDGNSLPAVIRYRQRTWNVNIQRVPAPNRQATHAITTLIGHNWRLLPAWITYWKRLGIGHFYLYFNDYMRRIAAEPDGRDLFHFLREAGSYITVFEWPFKFDVRVKVTKGGQETRLRLQHIAQPLRSHSCFYRHRSFHKYMWFFGE